MLDKVRLGGHSLQPDGLAKVENFQEPNFNLDEVSDYPSCRLPNETSLKEKTATKLFDPDDVPETVSFDKSFLHEYVNSKQSSICWIQIVEDFIQTQLFILKKFQRLKGFLIKCSSYQSERLYKLVDDMKKRSKNISSYGFVNMMFNFVFASVNLAFGGCLLSSGAPIYIGSLMVLSGGISISSMMLKHFDYSSKCTTALDISGAILSMVSMSHGFAVLFQNNLGNVLANSYNVGFQSCKNFLDLLNSNEKAKIHELNGKRAECELKKEKISDVSSSLNTFKSQEFSRVVDSCRDAVNRDAEIKTNILSSTKN